MVALVFHLHGQKITPTCEVLGKLLISCLQATVSISMRYLIVLDMCTPQLGNKTWWAWRFVYLKKIVIMRFIVEYRFRVEGKVFYIVCLVMHNYKFLKINKTPCAPWCCIH